MTTIWLMVHMSSVKLDHWYAEVVMLAAGGKEAEDAEKVLPHLHLRFCREKSGPVKKKKPQDV